MEVEVFSLLRFSYDNLLNDKVKLCFLYCTLYPSECSKDQLIEYWVCEDILIDGYGIDAHSEGYSIIGTLARSCLLEDDGQFVKFHDMIRDMALWIQKKNVLVIAGMHLAEALSVERWEGLRRLSLIENNIEKLTQMPRCYELQSLFLCLNEELYNIHDDFFKSMGALVVLNLSSTGLYKLPRSIERLVSLQYLDISSTNIRKLPAAMEKLTRLKHLSLNSLVLKAEKLVISGLSFLLVLKMTDCVYAYHDEEEKGEEERDDNNNNDDDKDDGEVGNTLLSNVASMDDEILLEALQCLKHLKELKITLRCVSVLEILFVTDKFLTVIKGLCLKDFNGSKPLNISSFANMKHLVELYIFDCELEDILIDFIFMEGA